MPSCNIQQSAEGWQAPLRGPNQLGGGGRKHGLCRATGLQVRAAGWVCSSPSPWVLPGLLALLPRAQLGRRAGAALPPQHRWRRAAAAAGAPFRSAGAAHRSALNREVGDGAKCGQGSGPCLGEALPTAQQGAAPTCTQRGSDPVPLHTPHLQHKQAAGCNSLRRCEPVLASARCGLPPLQAAPQLADQPLSALPAAWTQPPGPPPAGGPARTLQRPGGAPGAPPGEQAADAAAAMNAGPPSGGLAAAAAVAAEGSGAAALPPGADDSLSRLLPRAQGSGLADPTPRAQNSSLTEDDEDEVVEQDPTGAPPPRHRRRRRVLPHRCLLPSAAAPSPRCRRRALLHGGLSRCARAARPPAGRYSRYRQVAGSGRFKTVYKGFDEKQVPWCCCTAGRC